MGLAWPRHSSSVFDSSPRKLSSGASELQVLLQTLHPQTLRKAPRPARGSAASSCRHPAASLPLLAPPHMAGPGTETNPAAPFAVQYGPVDINPSSSLAWQPLSRYKFAAAGGAVPALRLPHEVYPCAHTSPLYGSARASLKQQQPSFALQ